MSDNPSLAETEAMVDCIKTRVDVLSSLSILQLMLTNSRCGSSCNALACLIASKAVSTLRDARKAVLRVCALCQAESSR